MGKSAKAKKEKKADFTKVKLKVGKKLPKGQNLTDTTFKSKKIVIGEQLKKHGEDELLTKKKLSLKELLSHLRHYSAFVRQDGLDGLRELLTSHPQLLVPALQQVLTAIAALLVDEDHKLRTGAAALLSELLTQLSEPQATPFLSALVAHVTCALTHLQPGVRRSSLPVLTYLLTRFPAPLAAHADALLPCLLHQLSGSDSGTALRAEPGSQLASATYRAAVLRLMAQVLRCQPPSECAAAARSLHRPASSHCGLPRPPLPDQWLTLAEAGTGTELRLVRDPARLRQLASTLTPLLFQTYLEVAPDRRTDGSVLSDEPAEVLCAVLDVLLALLQQMRQLDLAKNSHLVDWFAGCHGAELERRLLVSFPYSRSISNRNKQQGEDDLGSDAVNLLVCELAAVLGGAAGERARRRTLDFLTEYLQSDRSSHLERFCGLLLRLLTEDAGGGAAEADPARRRCLRAAAERHGRASPAQAAPLVRLLAAVVSGSAQTRLARCEEVQSWAARLLPGLRPDADASLLALLRRMAAVGHPEFVSELQNQAAHLLDCAAAAGGGASAVQWQRCVVELLFWPRDVAPQAQAAYERFVSAKDVDEAVKRYAREVLEDKYVTKVVDVTG